MDNDDDPDGPGRDNVPWHGTACAGIAAASRNDKTCGVGVAYDSNLSGRLLTEYTKMNVKLLHGNVNTEHFHAYAIGHS